MELENPDATADVNDLVVNDNGKAIQDVENDNVVVNVYHHDHKNGPRMSGRPALGTEGRMK